MTSEHFTIPRGGAVWSARVAHNHEVRGSNPLPATKRPTLEPRPQDGVLVFPGKSSVMTVLSGMDGRELVFKGVVLLNLGAGHANSLAPAREGMDSVGDLGGS